MQDAVECGLGWIRYDDGDFRLDLVEGEYRALSTAYQRIRGAPDLLFARAEEWLSPEPWLARVGFVSLAPMPHHRDLLRRSEHMLATAPDELAALLAKMAVIQSRISQPTLPAGSNRPSRAPAFSPAKSRLPPSITQA